MSFTHDFVYRWELKSFCFDLIVFLFKCADFVSFIFFKCYAETSNWWSHGFYSKLGLQMFPCACPEDAWSFLCLCALEGIQITDLMLLSCITWSFKYWLFSHCLILWSCHPTLAVALLSLYIKFNYGYF